MLDFLLVIVLAICLYTDILYKKIYNIILLPAAATALSFNCYIYGLEGGITSLKGLLIGTALLLIPFMFGGIGAGDVKLLGVIGAFKGPEFVWMTFIAAAVIGGIIALLVMIKSGQLKLRLKAVWFTFLSLFGIMPKVNLFSTIQSKGSYQTFPYGIAITAGTAAAYILR